MIARQTAVQTAIQMKGQRAELVRIYNDGPKPLPRGYRVKLEDLLCATYVSCVFLKLGWQDIVPPEVAAWRLYQNMAAIDCGVQDPSRTPQTGDLIFFGIGKKVENITHVGIVTEVKGTQIYYYDIQEVVGRHTCPVGYSYIWGYGIPDYASKDLEPIPQPEPHPEPYTFRVGDLVTINPGARWYKGQSIKLSCINDQWFISSIKGDRAVLGMNRDETRNICSPIHTCDITLVREIEPESAEETVTVPVTLRADVYETLRIIAEGLHVPIGKVVEKFADDAR